MFFPSPPTILFPPTLLLFFHLFLLTQATVTYKHFENNIHNLTIATLQDLIPLSHFLKGSLIIFRNCYSCYKSPKHSFSFLSHPNIQSQNFQNVICGFIILTFSIFIEIHVCALPKVIFVLQEQNIFPEFSFLTYAEI